jgi:hypothetical protein
LVDADVRHLNPEPVDANEGVWNGVGKYEIHVRDIRFGLPFFPRTRANKGLTQSTRLFDGGLRTIPRLLR